MLEIRANPTLDEMHLFWIMSRRLGIYLMTIKQALRQTPFLISGSHEALGQRRWITKHETVMATSPEIGSGDLRRSVVDELKV